MTLTRAQIQLRIDALKQQPNYWYDQEARQEVGRLTDQWFSAPDSVAGSDQLTPRERIQQRMDQLLAENGGSIIAGSSASQEMAALRGEWWAAG